MLSIGVAHIASVIGLVRAPSDWSGAMPCRVEPRDDIDAGQRLCSGGPSAAAWRVPPHRALHDPPRI